MALVKVEGTTFVRDTETMLLMNTDVLSKNEYYAKARLLKTQKQEINNVKCEIQGIKEDMKEIKELMLKLMDKNTNG